MTKTVAGWQREEHEDRRTGRQAGRQIDALAQKQSWIFTMALPTRTAINRTSVFLLFQHLQKGALKCHGETATLRARKEQLFDFLIETA